ncbi:MAG: hypothetical protein AAF609_05610 [Cyanobacteria bacterium P01_C01_bin.120]
MRFDRDVTPRSNYFLSSEFALGKLKPIHELVAISEYWNRHWRILTRMAAEAAGGQEVLMHQVSDRALNQALRLEGLISRRRNYTGVLGVLFREERDRRERLSRFEEAA